MSPTAANTARRMIGVGLGLMVLMGLGGWLAWRRHSPTAAGGNVAPAAPVATIDGRQRQLIDFSLTECNGRVVTRRDLDGQFLVVSFVFTGCSLNCLRVNNQMERIQSRVRDTPDVRLVSFTVDPQSDTPSALARFAAGYHADANRWWFLTGDKAEVYKVIQTCFLSKSPKLAGIVPGGFSQTDRIMLVDRAGNLRGSFDGTSVHAVDEVLTGIARLRAEGRREL